MNYKSRGNYPVKLQCVKADTCVKAHTSHCVGCGETTDYHKYSNDPNVAKEIEQCPKAKDIMGDLKCVAEGTGRCSNCHSVFGYSNYTTELLDLEDYYGAG